MVERFWELWFSLHFGPRLWWQCHASARQAYAKLFAKDFSQLLPSMPLQFLDSWLLELPNWDVARHATVEPFIPGPYEKYTNNSGYTSPGAQLAEAFSHFTWQHSSGCMQVTDLQGAGTSLPTFRCPGHAGFRPIGLYEPCEPLSRFRHANLDRPPDPQHLQRLFQPGDPWSLILQTSQLTVKDGMGAGTGFRA